MGIVWTESLSIGIEAIDNQHKELLLRFDMLLNACQAGQGIKELKRLQGFLEDYIVTHLRLFRGGTIILIRKPITQSTSILSAGSAN